MAAQGWRRRGDAAGALWQTSKRTPSAAVWSGRRRRVADGGQEPDPQLADRTPRESGSADRQADDDHRRAHRLAERVAHVRCPPGTVVAALPAGNDRRGRGAARRQAVQYFAGVRRVLVVGMTGAGKTTAARRLSVRLAVPFHELDELAIGPNWATPVSFVSDVQQILEEPGWVFDSYGYDQVREQMWQAADSIVWLDYTRARILGRVLRRSLSRSLRRQPVFGGNRETWRGWFSRDHPVWWAMSQLENRRHTITALTEAAASHATICRFHRPDQFDAWLAAR